MMLCCPITAKVKGYSFEVALAGKTPSVALSDQVRSLGWRLSKVKLKDKVLPEDPDVIRQYAKLLLE